MNHVTIAKKTIKPMTDRNKSHCFNPTTMPYHGGRARRLSYTKFIARAACHPYMLLDVAQPTNLLKIKS